MCGAVDVVVDWVGVAVPFGCCFSMELSHHGEHKVRLVKMMDYGNDGKLIFHSYDFCALIAIWKRLQFRQNAKMKTAIHHAVLGQLNSAQLNKQIMGIYLN